MSFIAGAKVSHAWHLSTRKQRSIAVENGATATLHGEKVGSLFLSWLALGRIVEYAGVRHGAELFTASAATYSLWGVDVNPDDTTQWDAVFARVAADGYWGIEVPVGQFFAFSKNTDAFKSLLRKHNLGYVAQIHTMGYPTPAATVADHVAWFLARAKEAKSLGARFVNVHGGKDSWSLADAAEFHRQCIAAASAEGIPVVFETHRQRALYSPWVSRDILRSVPEMRINADLSHWVCVSERVPDAAFDPEWPSILALVAERAAYIHARIGHAQGPQVADPTAPECAGELAAHLSWWRAIWAHLDTQPDSFFPLGERRAYVCVEHGPYPYMPSEPRTLKPVAGLDLWAVNDAVKRAVEAEFSSMRKSS